MTMNLKEKIENEFKEAFKSKDEVKISALRMLMAGIKNAEIEKMAKGAAMKDLDDVEVLEVVGREVKKRKEALEIYENQGRTVEAEAEKKEFEFLSGYLPKQMDEEEIRKLVQGAIKESGAASIKEMGKVMAALMPKVKGKADGALVSRIVKELLT
jgi:hypothetical protein